MLVVRTFGLMETPGWLAGRLELIASSILLVGVG